MFAKHIFNFPLFPRRLLVYSHNIGRGKELDVGEGGRGPYTPALTMGKEEAWVSLMAVKVENIRRAWDNFDVLLVVSRLIRLISGFHHIVHLHAVVLLALFALHALHALLMGKQILPDVPIGFLVLPKELGREEDRRL